MVIMDEQHGDKRLEATVHGRVQGVNFRYYTEREARRLNLVGWVANQSDGSVHVVAEGLLPNLEQFLTFLWHGSPMANVSDVDVAWGAAVGDYKRFTVRWL